MSTAPSLSQGIGAASGKQAAETPPRAAPEGVCICSMPLPLLSIFATPSCPALPHARVELMMPSQDPKGVGWEGITSRDRLSFLCARDVHSGLLECALLAMFGGQTRLIPAYACRQLLPPG